MKPSAAEIRLGESETFKAVEPFNLILTDELFIINI